MTGLRIVLEFRDPSPELARAMQRLAANPGADYAVAFDAAMALFEAFEPDALVEVSEMPSPTLGQKLSSAEPDLHGL